MVLHPELGQHFRGQDLTVPSKSSLYRYRIYTDLASMLFCRRTLLAAQGHFCLHVRLDASPQFGKEYLNGEADILRIVDGETTVNMLKEAASTRLKKRMLVGQIMGARATSTVHKALKLTHTLSLESECLATTLPLGCELRVANCFKTLQVFLGLPEAEIALLVA